MCGQCTVKQFLKEIHKNDRALFWLASVKELKKITIIDLYYESFIINFAKGLGPHRTGQIFWLRCICFCFKNFGSKV